MKHLIGKGGVVMVNQEQVWREFKTLPPSAQQQVLDFMAFLRVRYTQRSEQEVTSMKDLHQESFIGIWRDREDMMDSDSWLRTIRVREWG
jgi:hypothetical protein